MSRIKAANHAGYAVQVLTAVGWLPILPAFPTRPEAVTSHSAHSTRRPRIEFRVAEFLGDKK